MLVCIAALAIACGAIGFDERPARAYVYGSNEPLRIAVIDETGGGDWSPAIRHAVEQYGAATPLLAFVSDPATAHIVVHVRRYSDGAPPRLDGYLFQAGVGGFAAVYDASGLACNFPPAAVPLGCSGEIARAEVYLNDIIPLGADIDTRRRRLVLHELGHALGLTRHSPDLEIGQLAQRYGWR
jgi:hypothetical protein